MHSIELFWSFRSPYSYLATPRLRALERDYALTIEVKPVLPLLVRSPEFFSKVNPLWPGYLIRDTTRIAARLGLPFRWPNPDPVVRDEAGRFLHIHRLTRLGVLAAEAGAGMAFLDSVSRLLWGGQVDGWHDGDHLRDATARAGLDLAALDRRAEEEQQRLDSCIDANQRALEAAGHWGVPTMVFDGEPFFGQDRIDDLVWRLTHHGLQRRAV